MFRMVSLMVLCLILGIVFESVIAKEILENSDSDGQVNETENLHKMFKRGIRIRVRFLNRSTASLEVIVYLIIFGIVGSCYLCARFCFNTEEEIIQNASENIDNDFYIINLTEEEQKPEEKETVEVSKSPPPPTYEQATTH